MNLKRVFVILGVICIAFFFSTALIAQEAEETVKEDAAQEEVKAQEAPAPEAKVEEKSPWSHESGLGVALSGGNTDSKTVNFTQKTGYEWAKNIITINALFLYAFADGSETAKSWLGGLRYERELSDRFSAFLGHSWEGDTYAGYDYRTNIDLGGKYYICLKDKKKRYVFSEAGYRFTYEDKANVLGFGPDTQKYHFIRIYLEAARAITETIFAKAWVELLPSLTDKNDIQFNFEPSLGVTLTKYLSLKLSYLGKFDNVPSQNGLKKYDWLYLTALVAKF